MAEDLESDESSQYSTTLSLTYYLSFDMIKVSDPTSYVQSNLEEGSENIFIPISVNQRKVALSQSVESSDGESQSDERLLNSEFLGSVCLLVSYNNE